MLLNATKFLSPEEQEQLETTLNKYRDKDIRNVALLDLALATGARASELLEIKRVNLNHSNKTVLFRGLKGSRDREIPVRTDLFNRLVKLSIESDKIFNIGYHQLRYIWCLYRPVKKKFHGLRHSFAINLFRKTKDLRLVQMALGHTSLTNVECYLRYEYETKEMRRLLLNDA